MENFIDFSEDVEQNGKTIDKASQPKNLEENTEIISEKSNIDCDEISESVDEEESQVSEDSQKEDEVSCKPKVILLKSV